MAAIDVYLQQILDAIYGEEVRGSIHDSIAAMNVESSTAQSAAISARDSAKVSASVAEAAAETAVKAAKDAERYAGGGLVFQETILFANLPTSGMKQGWMYNIKDDFTTDDRFEEGAGVSVKAGTDIAWTVNNKWDVLATGGSVDANDILHKDGSIPADYLTIGTRKIDDVIGLPSLTVGENNIASATHSVAIGSNLEASASMAVAHGYGSRAIANGSIALGIGSIASGTDAVAHGYSVRITGDKTITGINGGKTWTPDSAFAGNLTSSEAHRQVFIFNNKFIAIDKYEDGVLTLRENLLDETQEEGIEVTLTVNACGSNRAAGLGSHAEGTYARASGSYSHAEGMSTQSSATAAHAEGYYTTAGYVYQHVSGKFNNNKSDTLFEVGNGTSTTSRSNAFEVTSDGFIRTKGQTTKIAFGVDADGNYGYFKDGADTVTPFKTGSGNLQTKTITPTTSRQVVNPDSGYDGFSSVTVTAINLQSKSDQVTPQASWSAAWTIAATVTPDLGYDGMSQASVQVPMIRDYSLFTVSQTETPATVYNGDTAQTNSTKMLRIQPTKTGMVYTNSYLELGPSTYMGDATAADVRNGKTFSSASGIQVTGTATIGGTYQSKTVTPTTSQQTVTPDSSYDALSSVTVNAIQTETTSATPSTGYQYITPTSGKYLTQVTVNPIPNQRTASNVTISSTKTYSYGYYPSSWTVTPETLVTTGVYGGAALTSSKNVTISISTAVKQLFITINTTSSYANSRVRIDTSYQTWTQLSTNMSYTCILFESSTSSVNVSTSSGSYYITWVVVDRWILDEVII